MLPSAWSISALFWAPAPSSSIFDSIMIIKIIVHIYCTAFANYDLLDRWIDAPWLGSLNLTNTSAEKELSLWEMLMKFSKWRPVPYINQITSANEVQSPVRVSILPHFVAQSTISRLELAYFLNCDTISRQETAYFPNEVQSPVSVSILPHFVAQSTIFRLDLDYFLNCGTNSRQEPAYFLKWGMISSKS